MTKIAPIALCLALAPMVGCSFFSGIKINGRPIGEGGWSTPPAAKHYEGPECAHVDLARRTGYLKPGERHPDDPPAVHVSQNTRTEQISVLTSDQPNPAASFVEQAAHVACAHKVGGRSKNTILASTTVYHARFDDFSFDHEAAAILLASTRRRNGQLYRTEPSKANQHERWLAGVLSFYAEHVDATKVATALDRAGAPALFKSIFMERLDDAVTNVKAVAEIIPAAEQHAFLGIPAEVRQETEAYYKEHNELIREFRKLRAKAEGERAKGVSDETVAALTDVRARYVNKHGGDSRSVHDGLPALIAHELFVAHITRGDWAGASVEMELVVATGPNGRPAAAEIDRRQRELFLTSKATRDKASAAKRSGLDAKTSAALSGGGDSHDYSGADLWSPSEDRVLNYSHLIQGAVHKFSGKVKKTKNGKNGAATIVFADDVSRYSDEVCRDTNKISRVRSDGRIEYKRRCKKTGKTNTYRRAFDPVVVPAGEAARIKPGDEVALWTVPGDPKTGRVRWVHRKGKLVLLRDLPVKSPKKRG